MGWLVRIKNEILLIAKDKTYDDLNSAEGTVQFQGDIKRVLNSILPNVGGKPPSPRCSSSLSCFNKQKNNVT